MPNMPKRGQRTATNKKTTAKKKATLPKKLDFSKMKKVGNADERAALDQQTRAAKKKPAAKKAAPKKASAGFDPKTLSATDRALYNKYVKKYGKPSATWANGKPRNPMTEVRNQMKK